MFLSALTIDLDFSSYTIINWISLLKRIIPINEVSLDSAVEKYIPEITEVTDTVDNIDVHTP